MSKMALLTQNGATLPFRNYQIIVILFDIFLFTYPITPYDTGTYDMQYRGEGTLISRVADCGDGGHFGGGSGGEDCVL